MAYKIHLIYDTKNWSYHSSTTALVKYAPSDMQITHSNRLPKKLRDYDLIVLLPFPKIEPIAAQARVYGIPVIIHLFIELPHFLDIFNRAYQYCDFVIFNNLISYEYMNRPANSVYIPQGIDTDIFYDEHKPRQDKALLVSSEHFRTLKGVEIAKNIPLIDAFVTDSYNPAKDKNQMRSLYNSFKVYICLSDYEGTPTPALEASACGCVVVSTNVGNMPELITHGFNGFLLYNRDPELIEHLIRSVLYNFEAYQDSSKETIKSWSWENRSQAYYDYFRSVL